MSTQVKEFGEVEGQDRLYAEFSDGKRVFIPSGYKGLESDDGASVPKWQPVVEAITGDHLLSGELTIDNSFQNWELSIEDATSRLLEEFEELEEEDQAKALIEYIASEKIVYSDDEGQYFEIEDGNIKLFEEDDIESIGNNRNVEGIYNAIGVVSATIDSLNNYLQEADDIAKKMEEMSNDIEKEDLFSAKEDYEEVKRKLYELGDGEGMADMEDLSESEKDKAVRLTQRAKFYQRLEQIDFTFAQNIVDIDFDGYHKFLKKQQELLKVIEKELQEVGAKIEKGEEIDDLIKVQKRLNEATVNLSGQKNQMDATKEAADEYEEAGEIMSALDKGSDKFEGEAEDTTYEVDDDEIVTGVD